MKTLALAFSLCLLAGCAAKTTQTGLALTGQSLVGVGSQFVAAGRVYTAQCVPAPVDPKLVPFCAGFKDFAPKFQQAYPQAVATWRAAVAGNDAAKAKGAEAAVLQLSTDLAVIAGQVLAQMGGN